MHVSEFLGIPAGEGHFHLTYCQPRKWAWFLLLTPPVICFGITECLPCMKYSTPSSGSQIREDKNGEFIISCRADIFLIWLPALTLLSTLSTQNCIIISLILFPDVPLGFEGMRIDGFWRDFGVSGRYEFRVQYIIPHLSFFLFSLLGLMDPKVRLPYCDSGQIYFYSRRQIPSSAFRRILDTSNKIRPTSWCGFVIKYKLGWSSIVRITLAAFIPPHHSFLLLPFTGWALEKQFYEIFWARHAL